MTQKLKVCTKCKLEKDEAAEFYLCNGRPRSECKACTVKRNYATQQYKRTWATEERKAYAREYMKKYYKKNKEKFDAYRKNFLLKNPGYPKKKTAVEK